MTQLPFNLEGFRVLDLSVTVSDTLPSTWPGHMPFAAKVWNYYVPIDERQGHVKSEAPYQTRFWVVDEHCGTHFDAPTHFIPPQDSGIAWAGELGSQTGDQVPLTDLMGPAACINVTHLLDAEVPAGESPWITAEHIKAWEAEHGEIDSGSVVLFYTGWDRYYVEGPNGDKFSKQPLVLGTGKGWPAPDVSAIIHLYERGVRCLGIDAPSIGASHDGAPVHREGLSRGMRYVEMLTGLGQLPPKGASFMFLPVKVKGSTGGPGRAIAFVK